MPVLYIPTPGVLVDSRDGKGGSLSLSPCLFHLCIPEERNLIVVAGGERE